MQNIDIKHLLESSEVEITGELGVPEFTKYRGQAIEKITGKVNIDGFRQGKVPENVLVNHVGEEHILMEMAEMALQELYPKIVDEKKIDAIGRPEITITKLAKDNPLGFKIKTAVAPEVKIADYKKAAKEVNSKEFEVVVVEDKEVDQLLEEIRQSRAHQPHKHDESCNHETPEASPLNPDSQGKASESTLPTLDDEFAKSLGQFETLEQLKTKMRDNLVKEKEYKARDKKRLTIMDGIIAETKIVLPPVLIEGELDRMMAEMQNDVERIGLKFEDYLTHLKKTPEEMRENWKGDAEKHIKTSLLLDKIATEQKLEPKNEDVENEAKHLMAHYPNVTPERIALHVKSLMRNEEVWKFLEEQK